MAIFIVCGFLLFEKKYQYKIYPGIWLNNYDLSNKTVNEARQLIDQQINELNQKGITFTYQNNENIALSTIKSEDMLQYINFDINQAINQAIDFGRDNNFFINFKNKISAILFKKKIILTVNINQAEIEKILRENFLRFEQPAQDATLIINQNNSSDNIQFQIAQEKLGKIIDYKKGIDELTSELSKLKFQPIKLQTETQYPIIFAKDCLNAESQANSILTLAPILFKYDKLNWTINKNQLANWLLLETNPDKTSSEKIIISLDPEKTKDFLINKVATKIDQTPLNAKFQIQNNKVIEFQTNHDGIKLNVETTYNNLKDYINNKNEKVDLAVEKQLSDISADNINDFGIKEIIGTGESNFTGSPTNRRHNIKTGTNAVNGLLIKPNEEFSLVKALGKIDKTTGYLPELVIKKNKTVPEYGGGLCQVGTTMFRTALASGLPITARTSHSYRVSYYEPAGTDATIYDPWPDLKFINDTEHYILIQTRIENDKLFFDFWGTKDGRITTKTQPTIYNIIKPKPTKIIETLDLPVGKKKCTEKAHNGADSYFDYKVVYPNNEIKNKRFSSHYVPWQAVCLLGIEKIKLK
ncbi:VanW family protein [Patescibacteria group bacterium]|nr:VanW family protein [Patescibacteria group bacterium]MBU0879813.1 VanW family protein [Patescibacteria group bacterium]MBU0880347.1 VanW family protein [Patescibacteria group bacterium]MBU1991405.1 VanW family protein [Patescibacteria group bacterium]MBU2081381.1 VanW family protein [Patescibacteria group bacterium]